MSYLGQSEMASNTWLFSRVAQCAATEGESDPEAWTSENRRAWAAAPGWDEAWASAQASHPPDPENPDSQYDPGADEAVITDPMILSQVQSMRAGEE